jgi:hypothetical protein
MHTVCCLLPSLLVIHLLQCEPNSVCRCDAPLPLCLPHAAVPTNCSVPLCFDPSTREKFWGFATAISPMDDLRAGNDSRLGLFRRNNFRWA